MFGSTHYIGGEGDASNGHVTRHDEIADRLLALGFYEQYPVSNRL